MASHQYANPASTRTTPARGTLPRRAACLYSHQLRTTSPCQPSHRFCNPAPCRSQPRMPLPSSGTRSDTDTAAQTANEAAADTAISAEDTSTMAATFGAGRHRAAATRAPPPAHRIPLMTTATTADSAAAAEAGVGDITATATIAAAARAAAPVPARRHRVA